MHASPAKQSRKRGLRRRNLARGRPRRVGPRVRFRPGGQPSHRRRGGRRRRGAGRQRRAPKSPCARREVGGFGAALAPEHGFGRCQHGLGGGLVVERPAAAAISEMPTAGAPRHGSRADTASAWAQADDAGRPVRSRFRRQAPSRQLDTSRKPSTVRSATFTRAGPTGERSTAARRRPTPSGTGAVVAPLSLCMAAASPHLGEIMRRQDSASFTTRKDAQPNQRRPRRESPSLRKRFSTSSAGAVSKNRINASSRLSRASATALPWLATSTSGHRAT